MYDRDKNLEPLISIYLNYVFMETHRICYATRKNKFTKYQNIVEENKEIEKNFLFGCCV